jgi:hypothetical protein
MMNAAPKAISRCASIAVKREFGQAFGYDRLPRGEISMAWFILILGGLCEVGWLTRACFTRG